ncbi:MAG: hypothetical protein ACYCOU_01300 [Sulfobacillus sp.]
MTDQDLQEFNLFLDVLEKRIGEAVVEFFNIQNEIRAGDKIAATLVTNGLQLFDNVDAEKAESGGAHLMPADEWLKKHDTVIRNAIQRAYGIARIFVHERKKLVEGK